MEDLGKLKDGSGAYARWHGKRICSEMIVMEMPLASRPHGNNGANKEEG
jgi:hypothetical protein